MEYIVESHKAVEQAVADLQQAATRHHFGVLTIHNLGETLKKKGFPLTEACQILEICNPRVAQQVLNASMRMNMVLPCRVSVYSEGGHTKIGMLRPHALLKMLSDSEDLLEIAEEVEETLIDMIQEAK